MRDIDKSMTCLIFGQSTGEPGAAARLNRAVRILVQEQGVRHFLVGPGEDFDWMAAQAVLRLRPLYPDLVLTRLHPAGCPALPLPPYFAGEMFPPMRPQRGRMHDLCQAARTVLPQVEHLILYAPFPRGWVCGLVDDAHRLAQRGALKLWDISQSE